MYLLYGLWKEGFESNYSNKHSQKPTTTCSQFFQAAYMTSLTFGGSGLDPTILCSRIWGEPWTWLFQSQQKWVKTTTNPTHILGHWFGTWILWLSIHLGMSSSQLTNSIIFQRGRRPETQPDNLDDLGMQLLWKEITYICSFFGSQGRGMNPK